MKFKQLIIGILIGFLAASIPLWAADVCFSISDVNAQRILTAFRYNQAKDGPAIPFIRGKIRDWLTGYVRFYESSNHPATDLGIN